MMPKALLITRWDQSQEVSKFVRGGAYNYSSDGGVEILGLTLRGKYPPSVSYDYLGFRCVRDVDTN